MVPTTTAAAATTTTTTASHQQSPSNNTTIQQQQKQLLSSPNNNITSGPPRASPISQSAFTPYNNNSHSPTLNPTPATTPPNTTSTNNPTKNNHLSSHHNHNIHNQQHHHHHHNQDSSSSSSSSSSTTTTSNTTMMSATSHLDNNCNNTTTLIYPSHAHFQNPAATHPFWPAAQWSFGNPNQPNGTAMIPNSAGSAFVPAVGYGPGNALAPPTHTPRPKLTTTIWEDEGTLCYQVDARGICVARRQDNDMINGTKLLNVVGMSRGKRDGILKNEKGRVVVKVGAMHLKGVWITFQRAKTLSAQFKINDLLYPLFVDDPSIFLHNSYGPAISTRIPSIVGSGSTPQWRPNHHYVNNFSSPQYTDATRQWYPYGGGSGAPAATTTATQMLAAAAVPNNPSSQDHAQNSYPPAAGYPERNGNIPNNPPAVPIYSANTNNNNSRSHPSSHSHPSATHLDDYDAGYGLINSQSQPQNGVTVVSNQNTEENTPTSNGNNGYLRGIYNYDPNGSTSQLIGQKRGFVTDEDNDDYSNNNGSNSNNSSNNNNNNNNQPSPPLSMHPPPPPLNNIAASAAINVAAAGSFPSPMNMSPNSSPGNSASAFSGGWNHNKRIKYEYSEATTPSSAHSSPRIGSNYQLPSLGNGPATPSSTSNPAHGYTSSNLQMVTNASSQQASPHHYSSSSSNNGNNVGTGPATGTTTPTTTTDGLDRYFEQGTAVLHTSSPPDNVVNTPSVDEF